MHRPLIIFLLPLLLVACSRWKTNEEYLDYLASIVLNYQVKHGKLPEHFSVAHDDSGIILPNRGDKNGNGLVYMQFPPNAFVFRSFGRNNKDDSGEGDDLDLYYVRGKKVTRKDFLSHAAAHTDPIRWDSYKAMIRK